jgi:hypothetical protein
LSEYYRVIHCHITFTDIQSIVSDEVSAIKLTDHDNESASISTLVNANMHKKQYKETVIVATSVTGGVVLVSVGLAVLITTISVFIKCARKPSHRKRGIVHNIDQTFDSTNMCKLFVHYIAYLYVSNFKQLQIAH